MRAVLALGLPALLLLAGALAAQGPLPGDVPVARALQVMFGAAPAWAGWLTDTAKPPLVIATVLAGMGLALLAGAGRMAALAVPPAFALGWLIDKALRAAIFAPRPTADLVAVASASSSSGLPSTFGLTYGSIFGVALLTASGPAAAAARGLAFALLAGGAAARVVLGGHWPSQMLASILLGLLAAIFAARAAQRLLPRAQ